MNEQGMFQAITKLTNFVTLPPPPQKNRCRVKLKLVAIGTCLGIRCRIGLRQSHLSLWHFPRNKIMYVHGILILNKSQFLQENAIFNVTQTRTSPANMVKNLDRKPLCSSFVRVSRPCTRTSAL